VIGRTSNRWWDVIELQSVSSSESRLRLINVDFYCTEPHLRYVEERYLGDRSFAQLAAKADVCVSEARLGELLRPLLKKNADEYSYGRQFMQVQCGTESIVHDLPERESFRFARLKSTFPRIAALWDLADELSRAGIDHRKEETESDPAAEVLRTNVELSVASDIRSGKFDLVLEDVPESLQHDARHKLSEFMPPPEEAIKPKNYGTVENVERIGLVRPGIIPYPQMAVVAHIQGDVDVKLTINASSGRVLSTTATGHPILTASAIKTLDTWLFQAPYSGPNPLEVVVHFEVRCGPITTTSATSAGKQTRKTKKKNKR
jgi:hypothetical protein